MSQTPLRELVSSYYDARVGSLLAGYVYGNKRIETALSFAKARLPKEACRILDFGCGIGATTSAIAEFAPKANEIVGLDLSQRNIEVAQALFGNSRVRFTTSDIFSLEGNLACGSLDAVIMIDVIEHVPRNLWEKLAKRLSALLSPMGTIILTTPTSLHQEWLAAHSPHELQIIDETVTLEDLSAFCSMADVSISYYELVDVWRTNQYIHLFAEREQHYGDKRTVGQSRPLRWLTRMVAKPAVRSRHSHVRSTLGITVHRDGSLQD